jgi:L-fucose isomerase-like protein
MQQNPRIGLILLRDDWPGCQEAQLVIDELQADTQEITNRLKRHFQLRGLWMIHSPESLETFRQEFNQADVDMVVLAFQTWSDGALLRPLLDVLGTCPLVLWCYLPWQRLPRPVSQAVLLRGSGPVGAFGALGILRNLGTPFLFAFGAPDDSRLIADLKDAGRAAQLRFMLRTARFGLLPAQRSQPESVYVDEQRLANDFGPRVQVLSAEDFQRAVASTAPEQVQTYLNLLRSRIQVEEGVSAETLQRAAQMSLGLLDLAREHNLDLLAVNSAAPELTEPFQIRPGLYPDLSGEHGILFQSEGDLGAATANYILHHLTASPTMLIEIWFWDEAKNQIVAGHDGMQNPELAKQGQVWVSPDVDFCRPTGSEGAQFQMIARPGRVTLFQLRSTPDGWQAVALTGVCLEGQPWVEAYPHAIVRLDATIAHFLNRAAEVGVTMHWIMAYGSVLHEIEAFCQLLEIPLEVLA